MSNSTSKKRDIGIDVSRGLCILFMIKNHLLITPEYFIYTTFYMSLFFFVSGRFFDAKNYNLKEYILKQSKALMLPFVVFATAHHLIYILLNGISGIDIKSIVLSYFASNDIQVNIAGALWFLQALFVTQILFFILIKIDQKNVTLILMIVILVLGIMLRKVTIPFCMNTVLMMLPIMYLGYLTKEKKKECNKILNCPWYIIIITIAVYSMLAYLNAPINVRSFNYGKYPILFYANAIVGIYLIIYISKKLTKVKKLRIIVNYLAHIGKDSIIYLCLNQIVLMAVYKVVFSVISISWLAHIFTFLGTIIFLEMFVWVFNNTKLKYVINKK